MADAEAPEASHPAPAAEDKKPATSGPGATYVTPMHPNGVKDTSMDFEGPLGMKFNPCVTVSSIVAIWAFCLWCMLHQPCDVNDFAGTCSLLDLSKEECVGLSAGTTWTSSVAAGCSNPVHADKAACEAACADCETYFPNNDGSSKKCECPCPTWSEEVAAICTADGATVGGTTAYDLDQLVKDFAEAKCTELGSTHPPIWTDDADAGTELLLRKAGVTLTAADLTATTETDCTTAGGAWVATSMRAAGAASDQAAIVAVAGTCVHYTKGCPATSTGYATEDALAESPAQDWSANSEFSYWKLWVAARFNWFYIGSQDVWIVFIAVIYFSKYSSIKLCKPGEEDQEPEYSDASWFTMLFCSGIGVGLFYFGVAEPVWHYTTGYNRYSSDNSLTDVAVAQDAMNLTFYHWGLHGFVVYTQVGLMLGIVSHRWGMPMTMKTCFYPLLGDKVFGIIGDAIDTLSVITTLFGVCTSLGLGVMQLATGLERLTKDDITGESSIRNTTATQVIIVWVITAIATASVVSGLKRGIQRLSNIAFAMGLMILFVGLYIGDTWLYLNIFVQSVGYYIQYVIELGTITAAFAASPFEILDAHGTDLSPTVSPAGAGHATTTENKNWMDWWTLFYWGWWIAWSPFVGTFMAKISKGRTVSQFIIGSCIGPITFGFIWFSIFGGAGINMVRDAAANGITSPTVVAVLEHTTLPLNGALQAGMTKSTGWVTGACAVQTFVHDCAGSVGSVGSGSCSDATASTAAECSALTVPGTWTAVAAGNPSCEYAYLKTPSLIVNLDQRSKEDMWYDMMLSYGQPDGFMGWLLYVFSMLALVLYFVTSSDSGSLVIDILAANGVEEPPVVQRIFWACMEGLTATALLIAGGSNALNALSTVSIVAGLPYTALLCFICTSTWRALKMDADFNENGANAKGPGPQFDVELFDIFTNPLKNVPAFLINTVCPVKAIHGHGNIFYTIMSAVLWLCFIVFHFIELGADGWWAMAWMAFSMNTLIIWDIRGTHRRNHGIEGNMIEDFFAALLMHGMVLTQIDSGCGTIVDVAPKTESA